MSTRVLCCTWTCLPTEKQPKQNVFRFFSVQTEKFFISFEDTIVEPRAVDPLCFDADLEPDPDPAQNLDADPDPDPGGEGVGQPKMCIPPGKILGTPLTVRIDTF